MSKKIDLPALRNKSAAELRFAIRRYENSGQMHYFWRRWIARMTAVEIHAIWERYAETRLVAALNHNPKHFIERQGITGLTSISTGLSRYVVRGGNRFFDFRSMDDLRSRANRLLGPTANPFNAISPTDRTFVDCLAAIRNCIVHGSEASVVAYKKSLNEVFGIESAPGPDEFLNAKDWWTQSPARYKSRLHVLAEVIERTILNT
jgi:hypothetical protein